MNTLSARVESVRAGLPEARLARWASVSFSASVLTCLISLGASQAFLTLAAVFYAAHLLRDHPGRQTGFKGRPYLFPPLTLPLGLFCLFTLISVGSGENPAVGWFAVRKLLLFLILPLGVNLVVSAKHLTVLYQGLFIESAVAGLVSVRQFLTLYRRARALHPDQVYLYMSVERVRGFMGHWMNFGGQQMLVFAALLAFLLLAPRAPVFSSADERAELKGGGANSAPQSPESRTPNPECRRLCWLLLAIVVLSLILNFTRGVWLGCLVATIYLVGCWRLRWLWALPALMMVGLLLSPRLIRQRVQSLRRPSFDPSVSIRLEMWQVGLRMIRKHPWVGVGPNNIPEVYTLYLPPGKAPEVGYREHLHNNFIQLGAERGLPCLAAWSWFMAALGWHFRKIRRKLTRLRWVANAATADWLVMLVEGCFEFNFGASPVLMLFLFVAATPFTAEQLSKVEG